MNVPLDFLELLRNEIRDGLHKADPAYRERQARWLQAQQAPNGGFVNRRGQPELYYTAFGLRGLSCLEALTPETAERAGVFLLDEMRRPRGPRGPFGEAVSAVSWWDAVRWCEEEAFRLSGAERTEAVQRTREVLAPLRREDGGWAKTPLEGHGSLYHTFLAVCAFLRMGQPPPGLEDIQRFTRERAQPDGGFLESRYSKRPGANGTAAGVALCVLLKAGGRPTRFSAWSECRRALRPWIANEFGRHVDFLKAGLGAEGGFHASPGAPFADLLSTYTSLFTLRTLGALDPEPLARALDFARALEAPGGGYLGFALEQDPDCEYAFYGLGVESFARRESR